MHYNPKYFPEPEKFIPERFLKSSNTEIVPFSYIPFGGGPRVCIGQRFAMIEMKIAMAKLLAKFKIVDTPVTRLDILKGDPFLFSYDHVHVKLEPRSF
jgi:cytochrome P450